MLDKFIDCLCNQSYRVLGDAPIDILRETWDKIYDEYLSILKNKEQSYIFQLQKDIRLLEYKMQQINLCISYLLLEKNEDVLRELRRITPVYGKFDESDPSSYVKDIERVLGNAKRLVFEHEQKSKELKDLLRDEGYKITPEDYDSLIVAISKFMGFKVDKKTTSVSEFAHMVYSYNRFNELNILPNAEQ